MYIKITVPGSKQIAKIKKYFHRPTIVYSTTHEPALLLVDWSTAKGEKYARVQFQNRVKIKDTYPTTDIPARHVIKAIKGYSQFMRDLVKLGIIKTQKQRHESNTK